MLKRVFYTTLLMMFGGLSFGQTDSTDLNLFRSPAVLLTSLDTLLYSGEEFEMLELDFTISDTLAFGKVLVDLKEAESDELLFIRSYTHSELLAEGLIDSLWNVKFQFGNLNNTVSYKAELTIENYAGALGTTLSKTITP